VTVDRLAAGTVSPSEVASLDHELGNDTVENRAFITKAVLLGRKFPEISSGLGNYIVVELKNDAPCGIIADRNVELHSSKRNQKVKERLTHVNSRHRGG
jgi:hypothetical protein